MSTPLFVLVLIVGLFGFASTIGLVAGLFLRWAALDDERLEREEVRELQRLFDLAAREPQVWR